MPVLEKMADTGLLLLVHGEVTDSDIDIFDREAVFIERVLAPLREKLPELRIVFEHITTAQAEILSCQGIKSGRHHYPHHLIINRNAILAGGINRIITVCQSPKEKAIASFAGSGSSRYRQGLSWYR